MGGAHRGHPRSVQARLKQGDPDDTPPPPARRRRPSRWSTAADEPDVQRPEDEARAVRHPLQLRADHVPRPDHLRGHLGAHEGDRTTGRRPRLRGTGPDRPLAGLRGQHQLQRQLFRDLHMGRRPGRGDREHLHLRHLAPAHSAPDRGGQGGDDHRPHLRRPVRAEPGDGLVLPRDGHVPRCAARARRALRVRAGMGRPGQAAVERGRLVRRGGFVLRGSGPGGLPEAAPVAAPGADQRRQLAVRGGVLGAQRGHQLRVAGHAGEHVHVHEVVARQGPRSTTGTSRR